MTLQIKQAAFFMYGKQEIKGIIIGKYSHLFDLKKSPVFACLTGGGGSLSSVTRQTNGVVFIPWSVLKDCSKIKVCYGKGSAFRYEIWRNIVVEEYIVTADVTEYRPERKVKPAIELQLDTIPF
ncbi:MAG TPA: hypothetical protein PLZ43_08095 [bacterium]|nr:hypothetical protein [bacterium]